VNETTKLTSGNAHFPLGLTASRMLDDHFRLLTVTYREQLPSTNVDISRFISANKAHLWTTSRGLSLPATTIVFNIHVAVCDKSIQGICI